MSRKHSAFVGIPLSQVESALWAALRGVVRYPKHKAQPKVAYYNRPFSRGTGWAHPDTKSISVNVAGGDMNPMTPVEITLHEMTHIIVGCDQIHNEVFNRALKKAALHLWPWLQLDDARATGYDLTWKISNQLRTRYHESPTECLSPLGIQL